MNLVYRLNVSTLLLLLLPLTSYATKLIDVKVIDRDYLMVRFYDGEVEFIDDGVDRTYAENCEAVYYGQALNENLAVQTASWTIRSNNDGNYGANGLNPVVCHRSKKVNGMAQENWDLQANDWHFDYTYEHIVYMRLPHSLQQGGTYTLDIDSRTNTDVLSRGFTYDIFNSRSEAIHVNLVGYLADDSIKAADLHMWMGDGGARDYASFEGNDVHIYNVNTQNSVTVGEVVLSTNNGPEPSNRIYIRSQVWNADFTGFNTPGTYRLVIDGVGSSEDFVISNDTYFEPFRINTLGMFYMRIGEEETSMTPSPRQPLYIPGVSPANTRVIITEMHPYHPEWGTFSSGDAWDRPNDWDRFAKTGRPENPNAYGGHADAYDWDRHLGHVSIIHDMLLPYILTDGQLPDDDLGIPESGNGLPDILDEARNEVDFWLRLRDGDGYSHGVTNPTNNNVFYQAGTTAIAAWANAVNAAMMAYSFEIAGETALRNSYLAAAEEAYNHGNSLANQMLNQTLEVGNGTYRGQDLKMTAAAYLYNLTGTNSYENMLNSLCDITSATSMVSQVGNRDQLHACVAYILTKRPVNYPNLQSNMKASLIREAKNREATPSSNRPSRRASDTSAGWFQTCQNVHRSIVGHAIADLQSDRDIFLDAMVLEADWGLGRNSGNMIYMTTAGTALEDKKSIQQAYTTGRNDGSPGVHPGHTPFMNILDWGGGNLGNSPSRIAALCYPDFLNAWPRDQSDFNTRYIWAHSEFTPQQTLRGKQALYGYLHAINNDTDTSNGEPYWNTNPIIFANATSDVRYNANLTAFAEDPDSDALTFGNLTGPSWLSVGPLGAMWGTPTAGDGGLNSWTVTVTDGNSAPVSTVLNITVDIPQSPYLGTPGSLPGVIQAEHYDLGGEGIAYHDTTEGNSGGLIRTDDVDISGEYVVSRVADGEWLEFTVNATAGVYNIDFRVAATSADRQISLTLDDAPLATVVVPNTGDWNTYQTVTVPDITLPNVNEGVIRATFAGFGINFDWFEVKSSVTGYDIWAELYAITADGKAGDSDNDGEDNYHEYLFGGHPTDRGISSYSPHLNDSMEFVFVLVDDPLISHQVLESTNLVTGFDPSTATYLGSSIYSEGYLLHTYEVDTEESFQFLRLEVNDSE